MSTAPHRRSRAKLVIAGLTLVLVLSVPKGEGRAQLTADAMLSGFTFVLTGVSRFIAFTLHLISSAALSCADR